MVAMMDILCLRVGEAGRMSYLVVLCLSVLRHKIIGYRGNVVGKH